MADISKIKALNGTTYDIKDAKAIHNGTALMTTNPFAGDGHNASTLYIPKIDNALYCAALRFNVTVTGEYIAFNGVNTLFNGLYDGNNLRIADDKQVIITIDFSNQTGSKMPGYPYGYIFMTFYGTNNEPKVISARVYNNYASQTVGWKNITFEKAFGSVYVAKQDYYGLQTIEITLTGNGSTNYGYTALSQIDMWLTRPNSNNTPFLFKGSEQTLYYDLTAPNFRGNLIGKVNNHTVNSDVPVNAKFTDTTYSDATASTSGLMSASDKTKLNGIEAGATANTGTITGITMNGVSKGTSGVVDLGTVITEHQDVSGKVNGPASSENGTVALFNGTTGKAIKDSGLTIGRSVPADALFLPTVTTSDNGKVLRVISGAWTVVNLPSASGVSF